MGDSNIETAKNQASQVELKQLQDQYGDQVYSFFFIFFNMLKGLSDFFAVSPW